MKEALASPKDAALKLALEALTNAIAVRNGEGGTKLVSPLEENAITAIEEALAQPIIQNYLEKDNLQQEPVAWGIIASNTGRICQVELDADEVEGHNPKHIVPLYTTPPQRTWVGLTDEEYKELHLQMGPVYYYQEYGQAIEAKLKEKNT